MTIGEAKAVVCSINTDYYTKDAKIEAIRLVVNSNYERVTRPYLIEAIKFLLKCLEEQNDGRRKEKRT